MILGFYNFNLNASSVAYLIFGLVMLFVGTVSIIMIWHWREYSFKSSTIALVEALYLPVAALLVAAAALELFKIV